MAIYNSTGYTFINTVLRKEINGSPITPDRFNNVLNIAFEGNISDEYTKFEINQNNSDYFRLIKKSEIINPDVFGKYDLSGLIYNYWHTADIYYNNGTRDVSIDEVTNDQWRSRLTSSMELPTTDYPICKIEDGSLVFNPLQQTYDTTNLVTNSGYPGTTDWVDTDTDGLADDWFMLANTPVIVDDSYGFDGRAQGGRFDVTDYTDFVANNTGVTIPARSYAYCEFEYYLESGTGTVVGEIWGFTGSTTPVATFDVVTNKKTKVELDFFNPDSDAPFTIAFQNTTTEASRYVYINRVFVSTINNDSPDVTLNYLKQPDTPYFDWYYDANDRILPLSEGETYTLQANERYIDKDDGTVFTSGSVIGSKSAGDDADNKTVEMEIPDDDKRAVFYSMLSKFGVSIDQLDATQYSMQIESKEIAK